MARFGTGQSTLVCKYTGCVEYQIVWQNVPEKYAYDTK